MEAIVKEKYIKISPTKMRQVLPLVKDKNVDQALQVLNFTPKKSARIIEKALRSAIANYFAKENVPKVTQSEIFIKSAFVDGGSTLRRFRPMSMGRVGRIRRRTSHLTIIIEDRKEEVMEE
jgi:large subunit ribosomal protein L22